MNKLVAAILVILAGVVVVTVMMRKNAAPQEGGSTASTQSSTPSIVWYGMMPHAYINEVEKGVQQFEKDTGVAVYTTKGTKWTQDDETSHVEALSTQGYKAFSIFPGDPAGANGLFAELVKRGQIVVAYGGEPQLPTPATFTVATDVKAAADFATEKLIQSMGNKGNVLDILETVTDVNTILRKEGVEAAVARHPDVHIIQTISDMTDPDTATTKIESTIAALGDEIDGMIATGYTPSVAAATTLAKRHKTTGLKTIHFIGIDTDPIVIDAIRDGSIDGTVAQNPLGHGYISCMLLKDMLDGYTPKAAYAFINSGTVFVDKNNVDTYPTEVQKITDGILVDLKTKYLNAPANSATTVPATNAAQ